MHALGFTLEELFEILRTCDSIALDGSTASDLQEFISMRLAPTRPDLAAHVRAFNAEQMNRLGAYIRGTYALLRS